MIAGVQDLTIFDDRVDGPGVADIGQRVFPDNEQIGQLSRFQGAQVGFLKKLEVVFCGRLNGLHGGHSGLHQKLQLPMEAQARNNERGGIASRQDFPSCLHKLANEILSILISLANQLSLLVAELIIGFVVKDTVPVIGSNITQVRILKVLSILGRPGLPVFGNPPSCHVHLLKLNADVLANQQSRQFLRFDRVHVGVIEKKQGKVDGNSQTDKGPQLGGFDRIGDGGQSNPRPVSNPIHPQKSRLPGIQAS